MQEIFTGHRPEEGPIELFSSKKLRCAESAMGCTRLVVVMDEHNVYPPISRCVYLRRRGKNMIQFKSLLQGSPGRLRVGFRHLAAAFAVVAIVSGNASASQTLYFTLDQSNTADIGPDGGNYGTVQVDDASSSSASDVHGQVLSGEVRFILTINSARAGDTFQSFGFNTDVSITASNIKTAPTGWNLNIIGNQDGFGSFAAVEAGQGTERVSTATITLKNLSVSNATIAHFTFLSTNPGGQGAAYFAAHLIPYNHLTNDTGYVGASHSGSVDPPQPPNTVPEPSTIAMAFSGLIPLGFLALRRRRRATV
jgi:hypothetical protein